MKKLSREEIIPLLLNRGTKTYKEISKISGYHEKSLIRISKQIERGKYSSIHGNSGRVPHNKIDDKKKKELLSIYQKGVYSNKKEFYCYLRSLGYAYSYSFLAKLIVKEKNAQKKKRKNKYSLVLRKTIAENKIQYQNKRYFIKSELPIKHHEKVILYVERKTLKPLFVIYQGKKYYLLYEKTLISKKGNTKY